MNANTGSITFQNLTPQPPAAAVTGANNGVELSGTDVVLGEDFALHIVGDSMFQSARQMICNGFPISFVDGTIGQTTSTRSFCTIDPLAGGFEINNRGAAPGSELPHFMLTDQGTGYSIKIAKHGVNASFVLKYDNGVIINGMQFYLTTGNVVIGNSTEADSGAKLFINGDLLTAQPDANGAGKWKLGKFLAKTATLTLDANNYISINIGGTVYKMAVYL